MVKGWALRRSARWILFELSTWTKAFCASIRAKFCMAKMDVGSFLASMAPKSHHICSSVNDGAPRGHWPKTYWLAEKPPCLALEFLTLVPSSKHDWTSARLVGLVSADTFRNMAFTSPPWRSTRPICSGVSKGAWCTWILFSDIYCCSTPLLCNPLPHTSFNGWPAHENHLVFRTFKACVLEHWPFPSRITWHNWNVVPTQTIFITQYFLPLTSLTSNKSIPKVWLNLYSGGIVVLWVGFLGDVFSHTAHLWSLAALMYAGSTFAALNMFVMTFAGTWPNCRWSLLTPIRTLCGKAFQALRRSASFSGNPGISNVSIPTRWKLACFRNPKFFSI